MLRTAQNASLKNSLEKRNRHVRRCDYNPSRELCPTKLLSIAALPRDVRKASGLPASFKNGFWAQPRGFNNLNGSAERFRTSGGKAERLW